MRAAAIITTTLIALLLPLNAVAVTRARYLMGTVCEITAANDAEIAAAFDETARIERFLSTWRNDSELSRLNRGEVTTPSTELHALLDETLQWRAKTNGAFDPQWAPNSKKIEEGAFGKGYALDRMLAKLDGDLVINFGGQLAIRGASEVTIADPRHRDRAIVAFTMRDGSLSTSSNAERAHIIDPRIGKPVPARGSASVIRDDALSADILSTALYVMGPDEGLRWAEANDVAALFIDTENNIRVSTAFRTRARDLAVLDAHFKLKD